MGARVVAALVVAACGVALPARPAFAAEAGLRWTGDARVAGDLNGAVMGGPALRFRFGMAFREPDPHMETVVDNLIGSWGGPELSFAVLSGAVEAGRLGTAVAVGLRPWVSRRQPGWFLATERISLLGVLIPDAGVVYGLGGGIRFQLGWEVPIGPRDFQIVPGVSWISPGGDGQRLLGSLSFRVPM